MKFERGISIDGTYFDVPMVSLKRMADFLDKYAERTEDGILNRELIGVYYNYTLTVGSSSAFGDTDYDAFWNKMTEPVPFHNVSIPTANGSYDFVAYVSAVSDEYEKILEGRTLFKSFTCKFTAREPARRA